MLIGQLLSLYKIFVYTLILNDQNALHYLMASILFLIKQTTPTCASDADANMLWLRRAVLFSRRTTTHTQQGRCDMQQTQRTCFRFYLLLLFLIVIIWFLFFQDYVPTCTHTTTTCWVSVQWSAEHFCGALSLRYTYTCIADAVFEQFRKVGLCKKSVHAKTCDRGWEQNRSVKRRPEPKRKPISAYLYSVKYSTLLPWMLAKFSKSTSTCSWP